MTERRATVVIIGPPGDTRTAVAAALGVVGYDVRQADTPDAVEGRAFDAVVAVGEDAGLVLDALRGDGALAALRAKNTELDAFASRASHDLKTPLAVISGTADTLRKAWDRLKEPDRVQLLDAMYNQATKAATMVNDLLSLARIDPDDRVGPVITDVRSVVDDALGRLPLRGDDEILIERAWPPLPLPLSDLKSILSNLVDNAHHYGRSADGILRLRVSATVDGTTVRIAVDDEGPGVPAESRSVLFQPDGRLEGSQERNPNSTGMGLAIVRRCVERAGGDTGVGTSPSGGASFWVTLPLPQM
jgi:signal transduction histidine kinase